VTLLWARVLAEAAARRGKIESSRDVFAWLQQYGTDVKTA
jgi:hypothetical protein